MHVIFYLCSSLLVLLMSLSVFAEGSTRLESIRSRIDLNDSAIIIEETQITLLGQINPAIALAFKKGMEQEKNISIVRVDSPGGDMASALEIALIIKNRKLQLIVDGRCFSACANFLFPAAENKTVLPGSFVAIHEKTFWYSEKGVLKSTSNEEIAESWLRTTLDKPAVEQWMQLKVKEKILIKQLAITDKLHNSYAVYLANRKISFGDEKKGFESSYPNCPPIQMWVLNKQQLISMGIKGIGEFWYPSNNEEKKMLSIYFKFAPDSVFYGEARDLELVCKNVPNNWIFRRFYDVKSSILSKLKYQP